MHIYIIYIKMYTFIHFDNFGQLIFPVYLFKTNKTLLIISK